MTDIVVTTTDLGVNVSETVSNITVTDVESNVIVGNITTSVANVTVSENQTLVNVTGFAAVSNSSIRIALGVENVSGLGNLTYDNTATSNGIIQYRGVTQQEIYDSITVSNSTSGFGNISYNNSTGELSFQGITAFESRLLISAYNAGGDGYINYHPNGEIQYQGPVDSDYRGAFSATDPVVYTSGTGVFSLNNTTLLSGQTTDNLTEGSTNLYWTTDRGNTNSDAWFATKTTDDLAEGNVNFYFTSDRANSAIIDYLPNTNVVISSNSNISTTTAVNANTFVGTKLYIDELNDNNHGKIYLNTSDLEPFEGTSATGNAQMRTREYSGGVDIGAPIGGGNLAIRNLNTVSTAELQAKRITPTYTGASGDDLETIVISGLESGSQGIANSNSLSPPVIEFGGFANTVDAGAGGYYAGDPQLKPTNWTQLNSFPTPDYHFAELRWDPNPRFGTDFVINHGHDHFEPAARLHLGAYKHAKLSLGNSANNLVWYSASVTNTKQNRIILGSTTGTTPTTPNQVGTFVGQNLMDYQQYGQNYKAATLDYYEGDSGSDGSGNYFPKIRLGYTTTDWEDNDESNNSLVGHLLDTRNDHNVLGNTTHYGNVVHEGNLTSNVNFLVNTITPLSNGNIEVAGNLNVQGNLNYVNVEDLLVNDQSITLNYGNATSRDAFIYVDRSGDSNPNVAIKWDNTSNAWQISNDGITFSNIGTSAGTVTSVDSGAGLTGGPITSSGTLAVGAGTGITVNADNVAVDMSVFTTDDLAEGVANLYYTNARVDAEIDVHLNTGTANTNQILRWSGSDYEWVDPTASTYGNADVQNFLENGYGSANITTTGDITAGTFTGDGSDLTSVRAETIEITIKNADTVTIPKGYPVHATGTSVGGEVEVVLADAGNAQLMPAHFIALEELTSTGDSGRGLLSGLITGVDTSSFTVGDTIFVAVGGGYANTAPSGEANLIQNLGVVTDVAVSGKGEVYGAGRSAATPNLDDGAIFVGSSANKSIAVDTTTNFDVSDTEFDLANALTNVNSIATETGSDFTLTSDNKLQLQERIGVNDTVTNVGNINGRGYGLISTGWNFANETFAYTGTDNLDAIFVSGSFTEGSNVFTVTGACTGKDILVDGNDPSTVNNTSLLTGTVANRFYYNLFLSGGQGYPLTDTAKVVSANTTAVVFDTVASANVTVANASAIGILTGIEDSTTGLGISFLTDNDLTGSGQSNVILDAVLHTEDAYGYPSTGPVANDFDTFTFGTAGDYSGDFANANIRSKSIYELNKGVLGAENGLVIGANTSMSNRGINDSLTTYGINMMFDGTKDYNAEYGLSANTLLPQILFKQYTNNTLQAATPGQGPRLFFTSAYGDITTNPYTQYPRNGQELGRMTFWGSLGNLLAPSSVNPPALISAVAAEDWTSTNKTNFYIASNSSGANDAEIFLAYEDGKLVLASGSDGTTHKDVILAPAVQNTGSGPDGSYTTEGHTFAKAGYANVSATTGAKLTVTHGSSVSGQGDQVITLERSNISATANVTNDRDGITNFYGGLSGVDSFRFASALPATFTDGDLVTIGDYTGSVGTYFNGNSYYAKGHPVYAYLNVYALYTDAAMTTPVVSGESTGAYGPDGFFTWNYSGGVTDRDYTFTLGAGSEDLVLSSNTTTHTTFHSNTDVTFAGNITYTNQTDGTVTSVDSGNGLTGGPITSSGTLAVGAGTGITVNTNDIAVDQSTDFNFTGNVSASNITLSKFQETVYDAGNVSGAVNFDVNNGSVQKANVTGNITSLGLSNDSAGTSVTLILTQGATTGTLTAGASWKFAGGNKTLSNTTGQIDVISAVSDGSTYWASLTTDYS